MTITLPRLSIRKGSSLKEKIQLKLNEGESLAGVRSAGYIKLKGSDRTPIVSLETKILSDQLEVSAASSSLSSLIVGLYSYYVELISGRNKVVEKGSLSVEP